MCVVNVQHNCAAHNCIIAKERAVRQEREMISELASNIRHEQPEDIVLNCAQMHSYRYIHHFYTPLPAIDRERAIHEGAVRELDIQKARNAKETGGGGARRAPNEGTRNSHRILQSRNEAGASKSAPQLPAASSAALPRTYPPAIAPSSSSLTLRSPHNISTNTAIHYNSMFFPSNMAQGFPPQYQHSRLNSGLGNGNMQPRNHIYMPSPLYSSNFSVN